MLRCIVYSSITPHLTGGMASWLPVSATDPLWTYDCVLIIEFYISCPCAEILPTCPKCYAEKEKGITATACNWRHWGQSYVSKTSSLWECWWHPNALIKQSPQCVTSPFQWMIILYMSGNQVILYPLIYHIFLNPDNEKQWLSTDCSNSSALALELLQSSTKPSIYVYKNEYLVKECVPALMIYLERFADYVGHVSSDKLLPIYHVHKGICQGDKFPLIHHSSCHFTPIYHATSHVFIVSIGQNIQERMC